MTSCPQGTVRYRPELSRIEEMYDSEYETGSVPEPETPLPSSIEEFLQGLTVDLDGGDSSDEDSPNRA